MNDITKDFLLIFTGAVFGVIAGYLIINGVQLLVENWLVNCL